ncbi:hypothetical protein F4778DRAFT_779502 [Xylariomycetidae sp. FL2044]|nr:hypothetical protein F4778DRAFT_779502 [Xylariomycetidae sp. FL2044]
MEPETAAALDKQVYETEDWLKFELETKSDTRTLSPAQRKRKSSSKSVLNRVPVTVEEQKVNLERGSTFVDALGDYQGTSSGFSGTYDQFQGGFAMLEAEAGINWMCRFCKETFDSHSKCDHHARVEHKYKTWIVDGNNVRVQQDDASIKQEDPSIQY